MRSQDPSPVGRGIPHTARYLRSLDVAAFGSSSVCWCSSSWLGLAMRLIFRSSPRRWPSRLVELRCVRPYVRTSTKSFSDFHLIWCVGRPWPHMHTSVTSSWGFSGLEGRCLSCNLTNNVKALKEKHRSVIAAGGIAYWSSLYLNSPADSWEKRSCTTFVPLSDNSSHCIAMFYSCAGWWLVTQLLLWLPFLGHRLGDDLVDWNSGVSVRPSVRPYVHKKFFRFPSNLVCG